MQNPRIKAMIKEIVAKEGGYVNHPNDRGGPTKYGVTQATLSSYLGKPASIQDVKELSLSLAEEIFYVRYYLQPRIDALPDKLELPVFDMSVNAGQRTAIRLLQSVINKSGVASLKEDGVNGTGTQQAAFKAYEAMGAYLINAYADERIAYYKAIVRRNPSQKVFMAGWESRAEYFKVVV